MSDHDTLAASIPTEADQAASAGYRQGWSDGWKAAMAARDVRASGTVTVHVTNPSDAGEAATALVRRLAEFGPASR